jgi:hypothetical protein
MGKDMRWYTESPFTLKIYGYLVFIMGLSDFALYYLGRTAATFPQNMGIVLGSCATVLLGLITLIVGNVLKKLERRLDQLEKGNARQSDRR